MQFEWLQLVFHCHFAQDQHSILHIEIICNLGNCLLNPRCWWLNRSVNITWKLHLLQGGIFLHRNDILSKRRKDVLQELLVSSWVVSVENLRLLMSLHIQRCFHLEQSRLKLGVLQQMLKPVLLQIHLWLSE